MDYQYSKSLGVCLLKYNKNADNEIHINNEIDIIYDDGFYDSFAYPEKVVYYNIKKEKLKSEWYDLRTAICEHNYKQENTQVVSAKKQETTQIKVCNFAIDISNNELLNDYLKLFTGMGLKSRASPEKDKEFILFQSPNDFVIKYFSDSVYLLYALVIKYGMMKTIHDDIIKAIYHQNLF